METVLRDVLHWLPVPQRIQFKIASCYTDFRLSPRHRACLLQ